MVAGAAKSCAGRPGLGALLVPAVGVHICMVQTVMLYRDKGSGLSHMASMEPQLTKPSWQKAAKYQACFQQPHGFVGWQQQRLHC